MKKKGQPKNDDIVQAAKLAIEVGYRHLDGAEGKLKSEL